MQGTPADCTQASRLIEGITAKYLLADRGYDSDTVVGQAKIQGMKPVIPSRKNRKIPKNCDPKRYRYVTL
ncbi:Transposase DDE domain-containing protein [Nitrosomonas sp. Nm132]|jgi:IS5 family transposase|nr:Transposase DDE domain-containing protein [Nitrosomonas sp. Nm132]